MKEFFKKFTSRKFLAALSGIVLGIAIIFGVNGDTVTTIAGAVTSLVSAITYIFTEGKIDANNAKKIIDSVETIAETIEEVKEDAKEGE